MVAGLNSTLAESHEGGTHYGWVGEGQLRWFAERLQPNEGAFRLGVVHHNVLRRAVNDDENLRDAENLTRWLKAQTNLLLHGHTHDSKIGWLAHDVPVLSTGSAALKREQRPDEVANQYQMLQVSAAGVRRWTRRYEQKRWIGDTACSDDGGRWELAHLVTFAGVSWGSAAAAQPTKAAARREAYLNRLIDEELRNASKYSELEGFHQAKASSEAALLVEELFADDLANIDYQPCERHESEAARAQSYPRLLDAFAHVKRAALLGAPGAGKSTTLRRLAVNLATKALEDATEPIPIFATLGDWKGVEELTGFLNSRTVELEGDVEALIQSGQAILLLDGLNEIPPGDKTKKIPTREEKAQKIRALSKKISLYVSCRQEDYKDKLVLGLDVLTLKPLTPERIRAVVEHWVALTNGRPDLAEGFFWQLAAGGDTHDAKELAKLFRKWLSLKATERQFWTVTRPDELKNVYAKTSPAEHALWLRHIPKERSLLRLAANPFMLVMLFSVWGRNHGKLPRNRGDLFGQFARTLLTGLVQKGGAKGDVEPLLAALANLAWRMQSERSGEVDFGVMTVVARAVAENTLGVAGLKQALDSTILEGDESGAESTVRFRHQLLQEYFAAWALDERLSDMPAATLWHPDAWWQRTGWEETAVLLAGKHAQDCQAVIRWLADAQPEVAVQCMEESGAELPGKAQLLLELGERWRARLLTGQRPEERAAVGRALGRVGLDQRKGVGVRNGIPEIDWVKIPAGAFLYQDEKKPRPLAAFEMAKHPVTNAQYRAFLQAEDGHGDDRWWQGLTVTGTDRTPSAGAWTEDNHPRERVSWFEAMAFCAWLSHKLGFDVSLPTEQQWERAARFTDGREYPWGDGYKDGYANIWEDAFRLERTSLRALRPKVRAAASVSVRRA